MNLTVGMIVGILIDAVQTMGVMGDFTMTFAEPLRSVMDIMSFAQIDLSMLNVSCVNGPAPFLNYLSSQLVAPGAIIMVIVAMWLKKKFFRFRFKTSIDMWPGAINAVGVLFM